MTATADRLEHVANCALCGAAGAVPWLEVPCPERPQEVFTIVRCSQCGLRYLNPRPTAEGLGEYYAGAYYSYAFSGLRPRSQRLKVALWRGLGLLRGEAARPEVATGAWAAVWRGIVHLCYGARAPWLLPAPAGGRLLDVGCGAGERLEWARDLGWETFGVDMGEAAVAAAGARGHRTAVGDIAALPFADNAFDYISLGHVLEHGREPITALREVARVLKPGGVAQVIVPNAEGFGARRYGAAWRQWDVPRHLYHFEAKTLKEAALTAGLRVATLMTLPDAWALQESRKAVGEAEPGAVARRLARAGDDENICVWCVK